MQQALDSNTLDRLVSLGRRQGQLTTEDLRESLPIEAMSAEEIALIVVHLEESGIPVELEDSLISPDPRPRPLQAKGAEIIPFPGPSARSKTKSRSAPLKAAARPLPQSSVPRPQDGRFVHWVVAASGLVVLAVLALLIFALGR